MAKMGKDGDIHHFSHLLALLKHNDPIDFS
jgi:hypothetical protein